ncbi:MAG: GGDEF domain-containing protein [Cellulosilyticaceae bacterium]
MLKISQLDELERWIEKCMKYCWGVVLIIALIEVLAFFSFSIIRSNEWKDQLQVYILNYILFPTVRNVLIVGFGNIGVAMYLKSKKIRAAYIGMITVSLVGMNLIYTHSDMLVLIGVIGIPVILSITVGDKKFTENISLLNGVLLLFVQIRIVETLDLSAELVVATLISSMIMLIGVHRIAKGLLEYYGNILRCWSIADEVTKLEPLTGTLCKKAISDELDTMVEEVCGGALSIALIDIDNMKSLNKIYGREVGDEVIKELARIIKKSTNNGIKVGRYGEDEFILLFDNHGVMQVITVCELIRDSFYNYNMGIMESEKLSASIGIATLTDKTRDSIELLIKGKEALKKAKESGKNKTVVS